MTYAARPHDDARADGLFPSPEAPQGMECLR